MRGELTKRSKTVENRKFAREIDYGAVSAPPIIHQSPPKMTTTSTTRTCTTTSQTTYTHTSLLSYRSGGRGQTRPAVEESNKSKRICKRAIIGLKACERAGCNVLLSVFSDLGAPLLTLWQVLLVFL
uniref:Uncharacterized protein n=1 Tax=Ditylenchus dipsaci TaxID=166011 RepID=A0A915DG18_9BILA